MLLSLYKWKLCGHLSANFFVIVKTSMILIAQILDMSLQNV